MIIHMNLYDIFPFQKDCELKELKDKYMQVFRHT